LAFLVSFNHLFIVPNRKADLDFQSKQYYFPAKIKEFNSDYKYPSYRFNTKQFVATSGIFKRDNFDILVDFENPLVLNFFH
jgi:hypothetical protein